MNRLRAGFEILTQARERFYPVDAYVVDFCLLDPALPPGSLASNEIADATVRNKEGGFFTAAADPSVAARAVTGSTPVAGVRALAALTDGLAAFHAAASERLSPERGTDASPLRDDVADSA